ncbi:hypothetical protein INR49_020326 [Caranx melampygus]|nr:hypothetical protein INR49_020326 [Caranx melampygus]
MNGQRRGSLPKSPRTTQWEEPAGGAIISSICTGLSPGVKFHTRGSTSPVVGQAELRPILLIPENLQVPFDTWNTESNSQLLERIMPL